MVFTRTYTRVCTVNCVYLRYQHRRNTNRERKLFVVQLTRAPKMRATRIKAIIYRHTPPPTTHTAMDRNRTHIREEVRARSRSRVGGRRVGVLRVRLPAAAACLCCLNRCLCRGDWRRIERTVAKQQIKRRRRRHRRPGAVTSRTFG